MSLSIKIHLRDKNKNIVDAWKKHLYRYDNFEISCGNIFDVEADAIVSPANSFGIMSGGIDYYYKEFFGQNVEDDLKNEIERQYFREIQKVGII